MGLLSQMKPASMHLYEGTHLNVYLRFIFIICAQSEEISQ